MFIAVCLNHACLFDAAILLGSAIRKKVGDPIPWQHDAVGFVLDDLREELVKPNQFGQNYWDAAGKGYHLGISHKSVGFNVQQPTGILKFLGIVDCIGRVVEVKSNGGGERMVSCGNRRA